MLINIVRTNYNVQPLAIDKQLEVLANNRAEYLVKNNQWSHIGWKEQFYRTNCTYVGENLARNFKSEVPMIVAWMNSPSHRYNILLGRYDTTGIGTYGNITVQLFCDIDKINN